jgi:hypothetical protein
MRGTYYAFPREMLRETKEMMSGTESSLLYLRK